MKVFLVQRLTWMFNDVTFELSNDIPMKAFESREDAEAYRTWLEEGYRQQAFPPPDWDSDFFMSFLEDNDGLSRLFEVLETELYL